MSAPDSKAPAQNGWLSGLLRKGDKTKADKKVRGKKSKNKDGDNSSTDPTEGIEGTPEQPSGPVVDDEGYIIRPPTNFEAHNKREIDDFYSSDSDESGSEDPVSGIHVVIKPLGQTNGRSAEPSLSELQRTVKSISLAPTQSQSRLYRRQNSGTDRTLRKSPSEVLHRSVNFGSSSSNGILMPTSNSKPLSTPSTNILDGLMNMSAFSTSTAQNGSSFSSTNSSSQNGDDHKSTAANLSNIQNTSNSSSEDRYAAFSSLFEDSSNVSSIGSSFSNSFSFAAPRTASLSKSVSSLAMMEPLAPFSVANNSSNASIPRPLNKRQFQFQNLSQQSSMSRAESYGSLSSADFRMTPLSVGSSRGSSPLTRGLSDSIPIAVAFQELISARFRGTDESKCHSQIVGSVKFAFPAGIVQALANNVVQNIFAFKLKNTSRLHKFQINKDFVNAIDDGNDDQSGAMPDSLSFTIDILSLGGHLQKLLVQNPKARYYNVDILKYQVRSVGSKSCPLQLVSHWKLEPQSTCLKVEYKYNHAAISSLKPIKNATFTVNIDANVMGVQGKPQPIWNSSLKQALWKLDTISHQSSDNGLGSLRAKFDLANGPSTPSTVICQFSCDEATLSGLEFELESLGYRVTMIKKTVASGRYSCEAELYTSIDYAHI